MKLHSGYTDHVKKLSNMVDSVERNETPLNNPAKFSSFDRVESI